jgi:hypothetical protein
MLLAHPLRLVIILLGMAGANGDNDPLSPGEPTGVSVAFSCAYRAFAAEFAAKLRPDLDPSIIHSALMLSSLCNRTGSKQHRHPQHYGIGTGSPRYINGSTIFVAVDGDDAHSGTARAQPKLTLQAGLRATRALPSPKTLVIGAGTYSLDTTLELLAADSDLTIAAETVGSVVVSGARALPTNLSWVRVGSGGSVWTAKLPTNFRWPSSGLSGRQLRVKVGGQLVRAHRARHPNGPPETTFYPHGWLSTNTQGNDSPVNPAESHWLPPTGCPGKSSQAGCTTPEPCYWGYFSSSNTTVPGHPTHKVGTPASCPLPSNPSPIPAAMAIDGLGNSRNFGVGVGGSCSAFEPPWSIFCGGWGQPWAVPSGLHFLLADAKLPSWPWADNGKGAVVQAFQWGHWASWMFEVQNASSVGSGITAAAVLDFGAGGTQGSRGGNGSHWYIEGVKELLDDAHEFFYDEQSHTLFFQPNSTTAPSDELRLETPVLQQLVTIRASLAAPVRNLKITGLEFRDAAPTFLEPHAVPSGGDWALSRTAALFAEGTDALTVTNCSFTRNDGNAIMLSGFHRAAKISHNHFSWTGGTAVVLWGRTHVNASRGWDGRDGNFPWHTVVTGNVMRENGIWEKQSSCIFSALSAQSEWSRNLCFNTPRAGFEFNDGAGGGDQIHDNLIVNTCRET